MSERSGVLMAIASSALGGIASVAIRFMIATTDPITLGALRFGLGALCLLPVALCLKARWLRGRDWIEVTALGFLLFGVCFALFNLGLVYTTATRGSLAVSTLPFLTMIAGAALGIEPLTLRKVTGVPVAISGVATAPVTGLAAAPADSWRGDLIVIAAAGCMALYNVWSRPFIGRSGPLVLCRRDDGRGRRLARRHRMGDRRICHRSDVRRAAGSGKPFQRCTTTSRRSLSEGILQLP
jgi:drug/metabolite transporter (DMT)-like permease